MGIQPIRKILVPEIPDKLYFRIGDVARLCEVPAYVLRFWETEFPQLKPNKGGTGQRLYRKRDVETALRIKSLLYDQGYTIPGARQVFKTDGKLREILSEPTAAASALLPEQASAEPVSAAVPTAPVAGSDYDAGAEVRRQAKLHAVRAELQALLELLQAPPRGVGQAAVSRPQAMRPRLVLEPRPAPPRPEPARQEMLRLVPVGSRNVTAHE